MQQAIASALPPFENRSGGVSVLITLHSDFQRRNSKHAALNQVIGSQGVFVRYIFPRQKRTTLASHFEAVDLFCC